MRFRAGLSVIYPLVIGMTVASSLLFAGCGGGSSSPKPGPTATPTVTPTPTPTPPPSNPVPLRAAIIWGPRSRQATQVNAVGGPSSALSAILTLTKTGAAPFVQTVTRGVQDGRQEYNSSPATIVPGVYNLSAEFHANENGQGPVVGTAAASVTILLDGTLSTTIATFGTIQKVVVPAGQVVKVGETKTVIYSAMDLNNNVIAITPGSAFLSIASQNSTVPGQSVASVNGEEITGINPTRVSVVAKVDNAVSPATDIIVRKDVTITVTPNPATVSILLTQQFNSTVDNDGPAGSNGVTYTLAEGATAGTVDASGLFTSTRNEGNYNLIVRSVYDPDIFVSVPVTVTSLVAVSITPNPAPNVSFKGGTLQLTAAVANTPAGLDTVTWSIEGDAHGGSVSTAGVFTAPSTLTNNANGDVYKIRATSEFDTRKFAEIDIRVVSNVAVDVKPDNPPTMSIKDTRTFTATVAGLPNATSDNSVTWTVRDNATNALVPGLINANTGVFTAPATPGTFKIIATSNFDPLRSGQEVITVASAVTVDVKPDNPTTLSIKDTRTFTAVVSNPLFPTADATVTWSVRDANTGALVANLIDATTGVFTAPATPGRFRIIATSNFDPTKSGEEILTVASAVVVDVKPDSPRVLSINGTLGFTAVVSNPLFPTADATVTWSVRDAATGALVPNLINATTGFFTAPATPGRFRIIATSNFDPTKSGEEILVVDQGSLPIIIH